MATEQTPRGPRDVHAERVCLAAGIVHYPWWYELRHYCGPSDFGSDTYRRIAVALDATFDVGPHLPAEGDEWAEWWPSSRTVRVWAVATVADVPAGRVADLAARYADGRHLSCAAIVAELAGQRRRIFELRSELWDAWQVTTAAAPEAVPAW